MWVKSRLFAPFQTMQVSFELSVNKMKKASSLRPLKANINLPIYSSKDNFFRIFSPQKNWVIKCRPFQLQIQLFMMDQVSIYTSTYLGFRLTGHKNICSSLMKKLMTSLICVNKRRAVLQHSRTNSASKLSIREKGFLVSAFFNLFGILSFAMFV